jgi:hypothetical protein
MLDTFSMVKEINVGTKPRAIQSVEFNWEDLSSDLPYSSGVSCRVCDRFGAVFGISSQSDGNSQDQANLRNSGTE